MGATLFGVCQGRRYSDVETVQDCVLKDADFDGFITGFGDIEEWLRDTLNRWNRLNSGSRYRARSSFEVFHEIVRVTDRTVDIRFHAQLIIGWLQSETATFARCELRSRLEFA